MPLFPYHTLSRRHRVSFCFILAPGGTHAAPLQTTRSRKGVPPWHEDARRIRRLCQEASDAVLTRTEQGATTQTDEQSDGLASVRQIPGP